MKESYEPIERNEELSEDELDAVAGGGSCWCAMGGGGTGDGVEPNTGIDEKTCACVLGGGGEYVDADGDKKCRCWCVISGDGHY